MTPRERRQAQIAITLCASVYGFTIGLVAPLIAVFLEQRGFDASFIGLNAAMTAFGMIAVTPILPRLAASLGIKRVIVGCLLVDALCLLSFPFVEAVWLWFVLRFLSALPITSCSLPPRPGLTKSPKTRIGDACSPCSMRCWCWHCRWDRW